MTGLVVKAGFLVASCHIAPRSGSEKQSLFYAPSSPFRIIYQTVFSQALLVRIWTFFLTIIAWPVDSVPLSSSVSAEMGELEARGEGMTCPGLRWISDLKELCRENFRNIVTLLDRVNGKGRGRNKDGILCIWLTNEYQAFGIGLPPLLLG